MMGDVCAFCHWPIDYGMGPGFGVSVEWDGKPRHHAACADYVRGWRA